MSAVSFIQRSVSDWKCHLLKVRWEWLTGMWAALCFCSNAGFERKSWQQVNEAWGSWAINQVCWVYLGADGAKGYWVTEVFLIHTAVLLFSVSLSPCRSSWSNKSKGGTMQRHSGDLKASFQVDRSGFLCWKVQPAFSHGSCLFPFVWHERERASIALIPLTCPRVFQLSREANTRRGACNHHLRAHLKAAKSYYWCYFPRAFAPSELEDNQNTCGNGAK